MISRPPSPDPRLFSAAILAGGAATRMAGRPKGLIAVDGVPIVDRQVAVLRPRVAEILAVVAAERSPGGAEAPAAYAARGLRVVNDRVAGAGPLAGLEAALAACATEWLFAFASDMPFLDGGILDALARAACAGPAADALVPAREGRLEPLHAVYRAEIAPLAARCLEEGRRAMVDLLGDVRLRILGEEDLPGAASTRSFVNLNTPADIASVAGRETAGGTGRRS